MEPTRRDLIDHVLETQRTVRSCEGCGLCCTDAYNTVRILPAEATRIAGHVRGLGAGRRRGLVARMRAAVARFRLADGTSPKRYTCPFLEPDLTCALPFDVKPVACLAFNPVHEDRCEMDEDRFFAAHDPIEGAPRGRGRPARRRSIPVAVLSALDGREPPPPPGRPRRGHGRRRSRETPSAR